MRLINYSVIIIFIFCNACNSSNNENLKVMTANKEIKITLAQIKHGGWDFKKQTLYTLEALKSIKPNSTDIIILPEMCPGKIDQITEVAKSLNTYIVAGVSERVGENKFANRAKVINNKGDVVTTYTKMFLHSEEKEIGYIEGDDTKVFEMNGIRIGILICGDLGLGVESMLDLFQKNVDLIVIPASAYSNSIEYWKWHMVIKSLDTGIPICMVNYAGINNEEEYTTGGGHSLIVAPLPKGQENKDIDSLLQCKRIDPNEHILVELADTPEIFTTTINLSSYMNFREKLKRHRTKGLHLLIDSNNEQSNKE